MSFCRIEFWNSYYLYFSNSNGKTFLINVCSWNKWLHFHINLKGGIFIKQKLKFNLFYGDEELENLLIEVIINYLKNKKEMGCNFG